jgi:hypothetical protein
MYTEDSLYCYEPNKALNKYYKIYWVISPLFIALMAVNMKCKHCGAVLAAIPTAISSASLTTLVNFKLSLWQYFLL